MSNSNTNSSSTSREYDVIFFITRAQPFHNGHHQNIKEALKFGKKVVVIVGSSGIARDIRNPFTFEERKQMIEAAVNTSRVTVVPLRDYPYNDTKWASYVQLLVNEHTAGIPDPRVAIIGHRKADTSYYLDMFPQWDYIECPQTIEMCATDVRELMFKNIPNTQLVEPFQGMVSPAVQEKLFQFRTNPDGPFTLLQHEHKVITKHLKSWENAPYAPTFNTVDAIVIQSGHVLMIKRKSAPGQGTWAIPGGYLEVDERIQDGMLRELFEETRLKVPKDVLRGSIVDHQVFDHPRRSLRGRIVTHAYCIKLKNGPLPKIKAASDAKRAEWVPLNQFYQMADQCFEDHFHIIDFFVSKLKDTQL